jgi:PAS domain S-box-containing protein
VTAVPTWLIAGASLIAGFAVADVTGVRPLGGLVLLAAAAWLVLRWRERAGTGRAIALLALYAALIPVFRRVTAELRRRHRRIAESEARYRTLMEQASDAIFVCDVKGRVTDANDRASELLGYTRDELLQRHAMDLMSIGDVAQLPLHMRDLKAGKTILVERPVRRKDGTFMVGDVSAKILADGRILTSIRDVTERTRLRDAQKLEAVGRFAGSVADELQVLLDSMTAHANALDARVGPDHDVDEIRAVSDATRALTSQLLAVGRRQELRPVVLDLNDAVAAMRPLFGELAGSSVELVVDLDDDVERVFADPAQLEKVIVDLVLHARAAMADGGTLEIRTASVEFTPNGRNGHTSAGRHAMLAISDTGGATDDGADRLGLGLAAVYGIVHQSGGSIGVESEPGVGTTVRIYLPAAAVVATV